MKKRLISLLLAFVFIFAACAVSAGATYDRVLGFEANDKIDELNDLAQELYDEYSFEVCYAYQESLGGMTVQELAEHIYNDNIDDVNGILLLDCTESGKYYLYRSGTAAALISDTDAQALCSAYEAGGSSYGESVHAYLLEAKEILARVTDADAEADLTTTTSADYVPEERMLARVVDNADVLTSEELSQLNDYADSVSESNRCDVAVVLVTDTAGESTQNYAMDFYDQNGYGYGDNDDGVLLLIDVNAREFNCVTHGYGAYAFTDAGQEYAEKKYISYLKKSDWVGAAEAFIKVSDDLLNRARNGQPFDTYNLPQGVAVRVIKIVLIDLAVGFLLAFIPVLIMKGKLKTVDSKSDAADYMRRDSFQLTRSNDFLINRYVNRVPRPKDNGPRQGPGGPGGGHGPGPGPGYGGGTSFRSSNSGRSFGSHGGRF